MRQLKITKSITNDDSVSLVKYLQEISKIEIPNADQEFELVRKIKHGSQAESDEAKGRLARGHLRFIVSVAKGYQNYGVTLSDLIEDGNEAMIRCMSKFDETRGFRLISYAVWWIRQAMITSTNEYGRIVRLPGNRVGNVSKIRKATEVLEQEYERLPTFEELVAHLKITEKDLIKGLQHAQRDLRLDAPLFEDEDATMLDFFENSDETPDSEIMSEEIKLQMRDLINILETSFKNSGIKQAQAVRLFYGISSGDSTTTDIPRSLNEIGEIMNLTKERARQLVRKAELNLRKIMRKMKTEKHFSSYL